MQRKTALKKDKNNLGRNMSHGILASLLVMVITIAIFTGLIRSERITEGASGYCTVCIHLLSIIIGACVASKEEKGNVLRISLLLALVYCAVLIAMTAIVFGGQYQGISATIFVILTGCVIPVIMGKWRLNVGKARRSRKRSC